MKLIDSYSDGMCGWVEMESMYDNTISERVYWSVSELALYHSQTEAIEEATSRIEKLFCIMCNTSPATHRDLCTTCARDQWA